ncbi:MAG: single-stranded DNA-binding protein [Eggerthellaceae bacterium]|nr:single-stranded DNA-binding protein [Eggerthellaceae bacterium]
MSINRVMISGNLTRDSELRQTGTGMHVLGFGVAVNDRRKNPQTGEWEDCPNFIDCTMFGSRAEAVAKYLTKGTKVSIEGKLRWSQWERDGQKRSKLEVIVDELEFMSSRSSDAQGSGGYVNQAPANQAYAAPTYGAQPAYASQPSYAPAQESAQPYGNAQSYGNAGGYGTSAPSIASSSVYDEDIPF